LGSKNLAAGLLLLAQQPFKLGERISVKEYEGVVGDVALRATTLRLDDGREVLVPNAEIYTSIITHLGRSSQRRHSLAIKLAPHAPLAEALPALEQALRAIAPIQQQPPPQALLILIAHRLGTLIPTIRSRARTIHFQKLETEVVSGLLTKHSPHYDAKDIKTLSMMAEGSIGLAVKRLEEGGLESVQNVLNLLTSWPEWDWTRIHQNADNLGRFGAEDSYQGFQDTMIWTCETLLGA
jgi:small-conductance mechanosensitive channel